MNKTQKETSKNIVIPHNYRNTQIHKNMIIQTVNQQNIQPLPIKSQQLSKRYV